MAELKPLAIDGTPQAEPAIPTTTPNAPAATTSAPSVSSAAPAASTPSSEASADPVAQWMLEHPEEPTTEANATETTAPETPAAPSAAPEATATPAATAATPEPSAPVATTPEAKPADAPRAIDPSEKITLAPDVEWTREQVVAGLRERVGAINEANAFRQTFGMTAEQAAQAWGPVLQRLRTEPETVAFIDGAFASPDKLQYLKTCAKFYDEENGAQPAATAQPAAQPAAAIDPQTRQTITELQTWKQQKEQQEQIDRVNRELQAAQTQYPILVTDRDLMRQVYITAKVLHEQNPAHGIPEALAQLAPVIQAVQAARSAQPAPAAAPSSVPALVGSAGGPTPTPVHQQQPARLPGESDVDYWIRAGAKAAGFE
jgi:hypothetical protein